MLPTLLVVALAAAPVCPAQCPNRSITVSGEARVAFHPNQVVATFLLTATHRDQAGVKRACDEKLDKLVKAVRAAGVAPERIVVNDSGAAPEYRGNELTGYTMSRSVALTITDLARVDEALGAAVRAGAAPSGQVVLLNTEHASFETKARLAAATAARERARGLTEALGARLGPPAGVSDHTPAVESLAAGTFSVAADGSLTTSFAARELWAASQVTVQFDLEPLP